MSADTLSVREIQEEDIERIVAYWLGAEPSFLEGMGVDLDKMPRREEWIQMLSAQLKSPIQEKQSYCIIWLLNGEAVGHSNINGIVFGQEAYMHLHLWKPDARRSGYGAIFVKMTIPWFFEKCQLKVLYCEPYALNPAPNRTLEKVGFQFEKEYVTTPGSLSFEQAVKRWRMDL